MNVQEWLPLLYNSWLNMPTKNIYHYYSLLNVCSYIPSSETFLRCRKFTHPVTQTLAGLDISLTWYMFVKWIWINTNHPKNGNVIIYLSGLVTSIYAHRLVPISPFFQTILVIFTITQIAVASVIAYHPILSYPIVVTKSLITEPLVTVFAWFRCFSN